MALFNAFKINKIVNDETTHIYVFSGDTIDGNKVKDLSNAIFSNIFDNDELTNIKKNNIDVTFIHDVIHLDDSIGVVKLKLFQALNEQSDPYIVSIDEMYMSCLVDEPLNSNSIYQILTQNDKMILTSVHMQHLYLNIYDKNSNLSKFNLVKKDKYLFDDILNLNLINKEYLLLKPLGQTNFMSNIYPTIGNPFNVTEYNNQIETSRNEYYSTNNNLMLDSGIIYKNNIYVYFADDVFLNNDDNILSNALSSKIYFPHLYKTNIVSLELLTTNKQTLIQNTLDKVTQNTLRTFKNINLFYDIYKHKQPSNLFNKLAEQTGILSINIIMRPVVDITIPIDIIFKLIHASINNPIIKYNPQTKQENLFRLFSNKKSIDGKKIPHLQKNQILKIVKNIGKQKSVSVYCDVTYNNVQYNIICEFNEYGHVAIYSLNNFENPVLLDDSVDKFVHINTIIDNAVNPIMLQIQSFFQQSGIQLDLFKSISSHNIEIKNIVFQYVYEIKNPVKINSISGCLSSIFVTEKSTFKPNLILRFKRVSNFNKRDSQDAFIIEQIKQGLNASEIVQELIDTYDDVNVGTATELVAQLVSELQMVRGTQKRRKNVLKINPGFKTVVELNKVTSELKIIVNDINDYLYIDTISMYIDSFVRITQDKSSSKVSVNDINDLCSGKELIDLKFDDIINADELMVTDVSIIDEPVHNFLDYEQGQNMDELIDMFGYDEFDVTSQDSLSAKGGSLSSATNTTNTTNTTNNDDIFDNDLNILASDSNSSDNQLKKIQQQPNKVLDITNMKLKYPNPFAERLQTRFPNLFVKSKDEKFDVYSRMCPSGVRRQPIILSEDEKNKIVKEHPNDVNLKSDIIKYGHDQNDSSKNFYYMCPRYWCLLTNTMVTEKDILDGKCGPAVSDIKDAIIPQNADTVPKNKYVYKFYNDDESRYPGFHKETTPNGLCIPCCYNIWNTNKQQQRRTSCQDNLQQPITTNEIETYIKQPDKYPLGDHRWGFLPVALETFLLEVNETCQISSTNTNIKPNHTCLLRHGVEHSTNQSFIACIATAVFYAQQNAKTKKPLINNFFPDKKTDVPSIKEMKELIIKSITIDTFITYQNADLIAIFFDDTLNVNVGDYSNSKLYKKTIKTSLDNPVLLESTQYLFFVKAIKSFEKFKSFLQDDTIEIDYTYLWDIVSEPNIYLFEKGINLIILEIPDDDITNKIELVCPTNHYSIRPYNSQKKSIILVKRGNYFEPVFGYRNEIKRLLVYKTFSEYDNNLSPTLRSVFAKVIKPTLGQKCKHLGSMPNEYRFKHPLTLDNLIKELIAKKYSILFQTINSQGKVIGVTVKSSSDKDGFLPCYPSSLTLLKNASKLPYDYIHIDDEHIWKSYNDTMAFLKEYYKHNNNTTQFNFLKVVEDENIVGFLTNTNQFIQINQPVPLSFVNDEIKSVNNNNYLIADTNTLTNKSKDNDRIDFIKRVQLETNFYNAFRNTVRILFNDYAHINIRTDIKEECNKPYMMYNAQLLKIVALLKSLVNNNIVFVLSDKMDYKNVDETKIFTCINNQVSKCDNSVSSICRVINNKCVIVLPKENLITKNDNEITYYSKMADELIRYSRIKSFIFKPQSYLSFEQIKYNLKPDEMLILQYLLFGDYFDNLVPAVINNYAQYNTYDTTEPIISQPYSNLSSINDDLSKVYCSNTLPVAINSKYWNECFLNYKEIKYNLNIDCGLYLIIELIKTYLNKSLTLEDIKRDLVMLYSFYTDNFKNNDKTNKMIEILNDEGHQHVDLLKSGSLEFTEMIVQDDFYPVNYDLWLLLEKYKIPSIFISSKFIPESRYTSKCFVCYTEPNIQEYAVIFVPHLVHNVMPKYNLIVNSNNISKVNIFSSKCKDIIANAINKYYTVEHYNETAFKAIVKETNNEIILDNQLEQNNLTNNQMEQNNLTNNQMEQNNLTNNQMEQNNLTNNQMEQNNLKTQTKQNKTKTKTKTIPITKTKKIKQIKINGNKKTHKIPIDEK